MLKTITKSSKSFRVVDYFEGKESSAIFNHPFTLVFSYLINDY